MCVVSLPQRLERFAGELVRIPEKGRGAALRPVLHRLHGVAELREVVAFGAAGVLSLLRTLFHELGIEQFDQRDVEAVHPYHRFSRRVAVVVESPRRRDDEVSNAHGYFFTVHRGVRALAEQDEALGVAVMRLCSTSHKGVTLALSILS